ncbi:MAG: hypothetical protein KF861_06140 [Planctomycetaceae bacterium]|nr:hypothetical protein [Planctomycetaceae bacterium]
MAIRSNWPDKSIRLLRWVAAVALMVPTLSVAETTSNHGTPTGRAAGFSYRATPASAIRVARYTGGPALEVPPLGAAGRSEANVTNRFDAGPPPSVPEVNYWIVSSRKMPQEAPWSVTQPLEVFQRLPDGSLLQHDMTGMTSRFTPGVPVCIFIHGTFVSADTHQRESVRTYQWVRDSAPQCPLHVIFYTWPSDTDNTWMSPLLINLRGEWAENNGFYLASLIAQLPPESPVCLVGHSHGGRAVASTLHLLGGGQIKGYTLPQNVGATRRYRAVLAAAAFDRHWLNPGQRYERALCGVEGLVNLRSSGDLVLHVYPLRRPLSRKAIGETGFTLWDRARLGPLNPKAIDLDVSPFLGLGHTWPYFYSEPRIAAAIVPYTYFVDRVE